MDSVTMEGKTSQVTKFFLKAAKQIGGNLHIHLHIHFHMYFYFFKKITKPRERSQNSMDNNTSKSDRRKIKAPGPELSRC